jgi:RNA polymerase sigma-70 factor (ECF subfamily)
MPPDESSERGRVDARMLEAREATPVEGALCDAGPAGASNRRAEDAGTVSTDEALVRLAQRDATGPAGRRAAATLMERYQERVYLWCYRRVWDHDRALDLAQDVMLSAYRALPRFRGRAQFSSWLFAIARNRCLSQFRAPDWRRDDDRDPDLLPAPAEDPSDVLARRDEEERLLKLVQDNLEPVEQSALWLRCVECLPVGEITRLLGIGQASGARGVLQSARRKLRAALHDDARDPREAT